MPRENHNGPGNPVQANHAEFDRTASPVEGAKEPYVKPAFRHEKVFETMALACGKINATQPQCKTNKKNS
jgi:hypothetical protein